MAEKEISDFLRKVDTKIKALEEARRLYGSQIAPDFYIFDYLRDSEMGLSRCIGNLLDPQGKHGQGDVFLKQFLIETDKLLQTQTLNISQDEDKSGNTDKVQNFQWSTLKTEGCTVKLEQGTDKSEPEIDELEQVIVKKGRIDIFLKFAHGEIIGIENKPWALDQENQLDRYAKDIEKKAGNKAWLLIYLCNSEPSEKSIAEVERSRLEKEGHLITVSYYELIDWLGLCIQHAKAPVVRTFIEELIKYIRKDINGEADMSVVNEVKNIILDGSNFEAAIEVSNAIDSAKKALLVKLQQDLKASLPDTCLFTWKPEMDSNWIRWSGFGVNFQIDNLVDFELWFQFDKSNLNGLSWGLKKIYGKDVKYNEKNWIALNSLMKSEFGTNEMTDYWPWRKYWNVEKNLKNWENNATPWIAIQNGTLVKEIIATINEAHKCLTDSNKLDFLKHVQQ